MMLIYIGEGAFLPGFPARDLTDEEVARWGIEFCLSSGLYRKPGKRELLGGAENKKRDPAQEIKSND
jgi:hypothetical protein